MGQGDEQSLETTFAVGAISSLPRPTSPTSDSQSGGSNRLPVVP